MAKWVDAGGLNPPARHSVWVRVPLTLPNKLSLLLTSKYSVWQKEEYTMFVTVLVVSLSVVGLRVPHTPTVEHVIVYEKSSCAQLGTMVRRVMKEWNASLPATQYMSLDLFECYDRVDTARELTLFDGATVDLRDYKPHPRK